MQVAQTILDQIKAGDILALARWGVLPKKIFAIKPANKHSGGLALYTLQNLRIEITLEFSDTYRVRLYNQRTKEPKLMGDLDDVYCDTLVPHIDSLVDEAFRTLGL
jgi:hypothetical protein